MIRGLVTVCLAAMIVPMQGRPPANNKNEPLSVCLEQLTGNPGDFHGKVVRVVGYFVLEFENSGLYRSPEESKSYRVNRALWINFAPEAKSNERLNDLSRKYVVVEGLMNAKSHGHLGAFAAELEQARKIEILSAEAEAAARKQCNWRPRD
jgi:hypothetical protein